jgi:hypothetical protein
LSIKKRNKTKDSEQKRKAELREWFKEEFGLDDNTAQSITFHFIDIMDLQLKIDDLKGESLESKFRALKELKVFSELNILRAQVFKSRDPISC